VIRPATAADVPAIASLVHRAYAHYIERIGRRPSPMNDDHAAHVAKGDQYVLVDGDAAGAIIGAIVIVTRADHVYVDNVAVAPERQGEGLGRALLEFADAEALRRGQRELRLVTNVVMTENQQIYARLGYEDVGRERVGVYHRVLFRKRLR
jgi:ribosomal protein S18 acetylase RimI-like enzyme